MAELSGKFGRPTLQATRPQPFQSGRMDSKSTAELRGIEDRSTHLPELRGPPGGGEVAGYYNGRYPINSGGDTPSPATMDVITAPHLGGGD